MGGYTVEMWILPLGGYTVEMWIFFVGGYTAERWVVLLGVYTSGIMGFVFGLVHKCLLVGTEVER